MTPRPLCRLSRYVIPVVLVALVAGCSREGRKAALIKEADEHFAASQFDKAEIEYKNALQAGGGLDPHAIGRLGIIYLDQGRGARAYGYLLKANELAPDNLEVKVKLAFLYAGGGKPAEARDAALYILEKRPSDPDAPIILAEVAQQPRDLMDARSRLQALPPSASILSALALLEMRERKAPQAQALLDRALQMDPKSVVAVATLARVHWARNEIDQADRRFAEAVALSPARSQLRLQYARFKLQTGKIEDAKTLLDESIAKTPDFLPAYLMRAAIATSEKKHDEAVALYDKVLQRDAEHPDALLMIGQERLALGANEKAMESLEKAVATFPRSGQAHFQLGNAYLANGDLPRAAASLAEAVRLLPAENPGPAIALARVNLRQDNYVAAVEALKPIVQKHPTNNEAKLLLADGYQKQGNIDGALAIYRRLIESSPQSDQLHFLVGSCLLQQGKRAEARQAFTTVLELAPTSVPALEALFRLDVDAKEFDQAKARLTAFATANPKEPAPHVMLSQLHLLQQDLKSAEADLIKALELRPDMPSPYLVLAHLQIAAQRTADAVSTLRKCVTAIPKFANAHLLLGVILDQQGDYAGARKSYETALELDPKSFEALNNLAYLHSERLGDIDKALEFAQRARDLQPGNAAVADTLGWLLYKKGQFARASTLLDESAAKLPTNGEARYHAGMAHYMLGNETAARAALQKALELEPAFLGHEDARQSLALLNLDAAKEGESARARLEKAIASRPADPVALVRLALLHERSGKPDQAISTLEGILKANPANVEAALHLIRLLRTSNESAKALELARSTRRLVPTDGRLAHLFGRLAYEKGEHAIAVGALQDAVRRLENAPEASFDLAEAAYSTGQIALADRSANDALQSTATFSRATDARQFLEFIAAAEDPEKAGALLGRADTILKSDPQHVPSLMVKAAVARQQGNTKSAREAYEKALEKFPDFTPAQRNLAILLSSTPAEAKRGLELATKARTAFPSDAELAKAFGVMLYHQGNFQRALTMLQESARSRASDADIQYFLGLSQRQLKNATASRKSLERALELGLTGDHAAEARKVLAESTGKK